MVLATIIVLIFSMFYYSSIDETILIASSIDSAIGKTLQSFVSSMRLSTGSVRSVNTILIFNAHEVRTI